MTLRRSQLEVDVLLDISRGYGSLSGETIDSKGHPKHIGENFYDYSRDKSERGS
jgi:hypothetical protein